MSIPIRTCPHCERRTKGPAHFRHVKKCAREHGVNGRAHRSPGDELARSIAGIVERATRREATVVRRLSGELRRVERRLRRIEANPPPIQALKKLAEQFAR